MKDIPTRYILTLLCFFGHFNSYTMRFSLSVAIVAMVKDPQVKTGSVVEEACTELLDFSLSNSSAITNRSNTLEGRFDWNSNLQGQILASFFYGYPLTQILGGRLAEKYGGKWVYGIAMLLTSVFTLLTPLATRWSVWALIAVRAIIGLAQGVIFPASNALIGRWAPKMERSRMTSFTLVGANVGSVVAFIVSGLLCYSDFLGGWPSVFYVFGAAGCIWFILWTWLVSESPEKHPRISKKELLHITTAQDRDCEKELPIPWKRILSSVPVWTLCITDMCHSWGFGILLIELPNYLANILHFDLKNNGALSAMPQLMLSLSAILASVLADKLREGGYLKTTTLRKTFNSVGFFGAGICMLSVVFVGCRPGLIVALLSLSMGMLGVVNSGFLVTHVDMSPEYAGTLFGMTNCCGALCGFLISTYVGWILEDGQTVHRWNVIFITAAAIFTFGGIIYNIFGSAEPQNWRKSSSQPQDIHRRGEVEISSNRFYLPKRYIVVVLGFIGMFNTYSMRVNLSVALVAMVNNRETAEENNTLIFSNECPAQKGEHKYIENQEYKGERYNWDPEMQGWILSSFFYGYCVTGFFGGYVAERFGAIRVFGGGLLLTAILSLLTPVAVTWGVVPLMVIRALEGLGEGVALPAMTAIVSRWSPKLERTRISAIILSGITIGTVVTMWLSGWLCSISFLGGWPSVFYVTGFVTCVWYALWWMFIYETPYVHPYITPEELSLFLGQENKQQVFEVPWKDIFTSVPFWSVVVANFGCLFGALLLLTELPTFLNTSLHFDVNNAGMLSALPYVFYCLSMWIASYLADRLRSSGRLRTTTIRKLFQAIAGYGAGLCLLAITVSGCRPILIVALFSLSLCFKGFMYSGYNITHTDMSPDFAGTLYGLTNGVASFSGIIGPAMVGYFTSNGYTMANWNKVFYVTVAIYFASTTLFLAFGSAELQPWGTARNSEEENDYKMNIETREKRTNGERNNFI